MELLFSICKNNHFIIEQNVWKSLDGLSTIFLFLYL